jgi:phosphoglycerate dehydrogenase-like enzyme
MSRPGGSGAAGAMGSSGTEPGSTDPRGASPPWITAHDAEASTGHRSFQAETRRPGIRSRSRVVVTWVDYDVDDPATGGLLREAGLRVELAPKHGARTAAELAGLVCEADAAIVSTDPFERSVFEAAPRLRVIARVGVGTDSIDLRAATEAGVAVTTTPGANRETAADHALALMLAAVRRVVEHDAAVRRGEWRRTGEATPWDLHGATVGIVGYGSIGQAVARRLGGFGTRLLVADPALSAGDGTEVVALDELLARADLVSLHLPLLPATRHIVGARELARMRPGAFLVNTSRGGLVDEAALAGALRAGELRGAALDVFTDEPEVPAALRSLPNVVLTPHVGGLSDRSIARMTRRATRDVLDVLDRGRADSIVNPEALAHERHAH